MAAATYERAEGEGAEEYAARLLALLQQRDRELSCATERLGLPSSPEEPGEGAVAGEGLEDAEALLAAESQKAQNPAVKELLRGLQAAAVYTDSPNWETNQKLWDAYAAAWTPEAPWVQKMASHLPGPPRRLECIGDEWSDERALEAVLNAWLMPLLTPSRTLRVAEVGSGGGRVAKRVAPEVRQLVCFDVSSKMLSMAKRTLVEGCGYTNVSFQQIAGEASHYPPEHDGSFEVVYCFDTLVHLDLHQMRRTLQAIWHLLQPGGYTFLSFANLLAPDGWRRFSRQQNYSVGGFYFVSPDIVRCLLQRAGFTICKVSEARADDTYLNRDLLVVAQRPQ